MAAPLNVYSNYKLPISGSTTGYTLPLALNLSGYTIASEDYNTNISSNFFLDKIFRVEDDFIGMVLSGGTNYNYHNSNRFSKVRLKDESNGYTYILLNDGGLNTKGHLPNGNLGYADLNYFALNDDLKIRGSYYANGVSGIEIYNIDSNNWVRPDGGYWYVAANDESIVYASELLITNWTNDPYAFDYISYRFFHENDEGVIYSDTKLKMVKALEEYFKYDDNYASVAFAKTGTTAVYTDKLTIMGSYLYAEAIGENESIPELAPNGYYIKDSVWYAWFGSRITLSGHCSAGNYPIGDPANPDTYIIWNFLHFEPNTVGHNEYFGCSNVTTSPNPVTIYEDVINPLFYTTPDLTAYVPDGWYYVYNALTAGYSYYYISNGLMIDLYDC